MSVDATLLALHRPAASADADGWHVETVAYRARPRPKPRFKSVVDASALFSGGVDSRVTTKVRAVEGGAHEVVMTLSHAVGGEGRLHETLTATHRAGLTVDRFTREVTTEEGARVRYEEARFNTRSGGFDFPRATYPETVLPFLLRPQPRNDKKVRAVYAWTCDRFCARVYYQRRRRTQVVVPAGRFEVDVVWLYPDLNDWVAMGAMLTKLAKPLIPRYTLCYEAAPPHRLVSFEGPYGPPGAPELLLELV